MNRKNSIRIACAVLISASVFIMTCFFGLLLVKTTLGSTSYAVTTPLLLPLALIPTFISARIFSVSAAEEPEYREDEAEEDETEEAFNSFVQPQLDESAYPELFKSKQAADAPLEISRPDIKALLREQGGEFEAEANKEEKEELDDFLYNIEEEEKKLSFYDDLPTELPEDYVPYEYDSEEEEDEAEDEEEYTITPLHKVVAKIILTVASAAIAIVLPINSATVYSTDSVTVRRPFSKTEYVFEDAAYYTVGVKLSGDISMKLHFKDGETKDILFPDTALKSESFKNNFSSKYAYAAFCDRLLQRAGVEKRIDDLVSINPSASLSQKDMAYIEEITETDLTP